MLIACNSGSSNITIGASIIGGTNGTTTTGNSCSDMETGSTCVISLNLSNNSTPDLNLTYSTLPTPFTNNPTFTTDVDACNQQINDSNNVPITCQITVTYQNTNPGTLPNSQVANLTFYLGNTSNPDQAASPLITLSGN